MTLDDLIRTIVARRIPVRFVSPHLDDAVLSCGTLIADLSLRTDVKVWTVFTEGAAPPYTLSARAFLSQCGVADARRLFSLRRMEDRDALGALRVPFEHLGFVDALFRRRPSGPVRRAIGRILPEVAHAYPTYRLHVSRGKIAPSDTALVSSITERLAAMAHRDGDPVIFFPFGLGNHVDHVLLSWIGRSFPGSVVFYSDFPYSLTDTPDPNECASRGLSTYAYDREPARKHPMIRAYATQHLFSGEIPSVPETYHVSDSVFTARV